MASNSAEKIEIENVNVPGHITRVDKAKYMTMKKAMLKILPKKSPGYTQNQIREAVVEHLDQTLFPNGEKAGWWAKSVQLDLEAKGQLAREKSKPLRWYRIP